MNLNRRAVLFQTSTYFFKICEWFEPQVNSFHRKSILDTIALWDSVFIALRVSYYIVRQHYFFRKAYSVPWFTSILITDTFTSPVWILGKVRRFPFPRHPGDYSLVSPSCFQRQACGGKKSKFLTLKATEPAREIMIMGLLYGLVFLLKQETRACLEIARAWVEGLLTLD